jgi:2-oxoglutarate ferredoxin oxidoreductase subunit gamma
MVKPDPLSPLQHIPVPATEKALKEIGNQMVANMVLLGAVVKALGLVKEESLRQVVSNRIPPSFLELNMKALALGIDWGKKGRV